MNKTPEYTLRAIKAYKARQNEDPIKREQNKIKHREYMRQYRLKKKWKSVGRTHKILWIWKIKVYLNQNNFLQLVHIIYHN